MAEIPLVPKKKRIMFRFHSSLLLCVSFLAAPLATGADAMPKPPNVVVFLIDDLGWKDLGCTGSTFYETPNIDRLAAAGVRFTHSYAAHPVCSPTRAALMTGKAPQRLGILNWIHQPSDIHLAHRETTIGEAFQAAGYQTGYIGKWHLGEKDDQLPSSHGFSWMRCVNRAGQPASYFFPYKRQSKRGNYWDVPDLEDGQPGDYLTDALTDQALGFIEANRSRPFFLYFAHYAVHTPIQAPEQLVRKYEAKRRRFYRDTPTPKVGPGRYGDTYARGRQDHPVYAAMIENLDTNIGRVLKKLDELALTENTIILFTSDNGGLAETRKMGVTCTLPLRAGKGWNYQGGVRIPTIFAWRGHLRSATVSVPIVSMDMYPTLLELAGLPLRPQQHGDGRSLVPLLKGGADPALADRTFCWTYPFGHGSGHKPSSALQQGEWKLLHFQVGSPVELYRLSDDPGEKHDLSGQYPEKTQALLAELNRWLKRTTRPNPRD